MNLLADVSCASLPLSALPLLAGLRTNEDLRCWVRDDRLWVRWQAGADEVTAYLLPIEGVEMFEQRDGLWYRPGKHLPVFTVPDEGEASSLARLLNPAPAVPIPSGQPDFSPLPFRLVHHEHEHPATAELCSLRDLARWADLATSRQLAGLTAAWCGERVLVCGRALPALAESTRFWGDRVLTPLGFRSDPPLPEGMLVMALGLNPGEVALVHPEGIEVVPSEAFGPLTRAGVRLALQRRVDGRS
jgi:hypothetical protein